MIQIYDFVCENLNFLYENLNFLYKNLRFSLWKIFMIFSMTFQRFIKSITTKLEFLRGPERRNWLIDSFLMVYRNNAGRLGSGFISVCLETQVRWLGRWGGFYVPERPCIKEIRKYIKKKINE